MKQFKIITFLTFLVLLSGCISNKRLVYLQSKKTGRPNVDSTDLIYNRFKYQLQVNDILYINVKSYDEKTTAVFNTMASDMRFGANNAEVLFYVNSYTVENDGTIEMPILGKIAIAGKNLQQAKDIIQAKLNEYFNNALVVVRYAGLKFSILGEVRTPGKFVLYQNQVTLFDALASAGDLNLIGNRKNVALIRQYPEGVKVSIIDLTNVDIIKSPMYFIQPNDVVYVPPMKVREFGTGLNAFNTIQTLATVLSALFLALNLINNK